MEIVFQPEKKMGDILIEYMGKKHNFNRLFIIVAYLRKSGLDHIITPLKEFIKRGGEIKVISGIDQKSTSYQGLEKLIEIGGDVKVFHNESFSSTFHPKMYFFINEERAVIIIGSNNLTSGGLYSNYEISSINELNLLIEKDKSNYEALMKIIDDLEQEEGLIKILSKETLDELKEGDYLLDENGSEMTEKIIKDHRNGESAKLFESKTIKIPKKEIIQKRIFQKDFDELFEDSTDNGTPIEYEEADVGDVLWKKDSLPGTDVLYQKTGTNPTGCLRLTQAHYKVRGEIIDQTTYFREDIFGRSKWKTVKMNPFVEVAIVPFHIYVDNLYLGKHMLEIRHKPSGEAKQGNYTTSISWGSLSATLQKKDHRGKELTLYAPSEADPDSFTMVII